MSRFRLNKDESPSIPRPDTIPMKRQELLKWYGWGYKDTEWTFNDVTGQLNCTSDRYPLINSYFNPGFMREHVLKKYNVDLHSPPLHGKQKFEMPETFPEPVINKNFVNEIENLKIASSVDGEDRYFRAHGNETRELLKIHQRKQFSRIPDFIIFPTCHTHVVQIVELANLHNVVLIPFGGGTNVSQALSCNPEENRMIVSLDTSQMNRVLWIDKANHVACCEAGIIGQDLGRELEKHGLTLGHEPDSYEFSSLGGWIATRASGMKKNKYGNIEDMVAHIRLVTPAGVLEKNCYSPRVSCGPDFNQIVLGSEGTLGIVTEAIIKLRPIPDVREFASFVFPNFELGVEFSRILGIKQCKPASLRLFDNCQYKMGQLFKEPRGPIGYVIEYLQTTYLNKIKGINEDQMAVVVAVFEGDADEVTTLMKKVNKIAEQHQGFAAGGSHGKRGYALTFTIAYMRDICFLYGIMSDSFETSVPWDRVMTVCRNVKNTVSKECKSRDIKYFEISVRLTQVYDTGACLYFYFSFNMAGVKDAMFEEIVAMARDEILACGGSLSHHHGVGKIRQKWFSQSVSPLGVELCKAVKRQLDPNNIFAVGNIWKQ